MIIDKIDFPIYGIMIILSLISGALFNYLYLKKTGIEKRKIMLFIMMSAFYAIICGTILDSIINYSKGRTTIGLSSYGGAIGVILGSIIFERISPSKNAFIKGAVISLPLIYSISKIGCFFAGCCYGLPYNGIFSITYKAELNIPLVPVQLLETIMFMMIFIICALFRKKDRIIGLAITMCALGKFLLDFLRYNHLNEIISINQIISIVFIIVGLFIIFKQNNLKKDKKY